jgi:hypothetical protein
MDELIVVFRAAGLSEAEIVKGFLESEEIPATLSYESAGAVYGLTVDGLGEVRVEVPSAYAAVAWRLLDEQLKERPDVEGVLPMRPAWPNAEGPDGDEPDVA